MKQQSLAQLHCEQPTFSRHEDHQKTLHSRTEEEKLKRRLEWKRQRELEEEHERKKKKMIMEYELKRLEHLRHLKRRSCSRSKSRSKSRSSSPRKPRRSSAVEQKKQSSIMSEKLETTSGTSPLFKGPEGTQIRPSELHAIKVDIHRNIPARETIAELKHDIVDPEDVVLTRRDERTSGTSPLFKGPEGIQIRPSELRAIKVSIHRNIPTRETTAELKRDIVDPEDVILTRREERTSGTSPLFKGPEGIQIRPSELRAIKVSIHRNIPTRETTAELKRDIVDPEDVILTRREGEGCKPIFEREEIKKAISKPEEVKELRTVIKTIDHDSLARKPESSRKRSVSLSPLRHRSCSSHRSSSRQSSHSDSKYRTDRSAYHRSSTRERYGERSTDRYRAYKERGSGKSTRSRDYSTRRRLSRDRSREHSRERSRDRSRDPSRSRGREQKRRELDTRKERSRERSREMRERARSRERIPPSTHYYEPVPVPIYYGEFPPRPLMFRPVMPIRGQIPRARGRPPIMGPVRPFPPHLPLDMFRMGPPNTRFGPMC